MIKKVPLTASINGERKVIGSAYVEVVDGQIDVTGDIDIEYAKQISAPITGISLGGHGNLDEAHIV